MAAEGSLKNKTRSGLVWSSFEKLSYQGLQFIFSIILARLLSPEDYGLVAMPLIFLQIAQVFIDSGFSNAIIRKPDLKEEDLSTAFYFNIGVGVISYVILFTCSPLIANFYNTPQLSSILKVTALATLFTPLCAVQQAILTIKLNFRKQALITLIAQLVTGIVGIGMAYSGYGVWSLVISQAVASLIRTVLLWCMSGWYPKTGWSKESFNYLWGFGNKLLGVGLIDCLYQNIYTLVIGKFYTKAELGLYTRGHGLAHLPTNIYNSVIKRVTFPVLSSVQDDDERMMLIFRKVYSTTSFVIFPLMLSMAGMAKPLVSVLLSEKWLGMVPYFQILCLAMMWIPMDSLNLNLLTIKGRTDLFLKLEILKKSIGAVILLITLSHGVSSLCWGYAAYCIIEVILDTRYSGKFYKYGFLKQMKDVGLVLVLSVLLFFANYCLTLSLDCNKYILLLLSVLVSGFIFYTYSSLFLKKTAKDAIAFIIKK